MKVFWIVCLIVLVLLLVLMAGYLLIGFVAYKICLTRKGKIKRTIEKKFATYVKEWGIDEHYFETGFEKISIKSHDNLSLYAFYKTIGQNKLAIFVHGYGGTHRDMANYAKMFEQRGYDILAVDQRCHGESDGYDLTMGLKEKEDILFWINKMNEINPQYKIVLMGLSMGASSVCLACGEKLPANVVLAIEDCGYDNANNQFSHVYFKSKFPLKFIYKIFYNFTKKSRGLDLKKIDAKIALKNSKIPILFIHGSNDDFVPTAMVNSLSSAIPEQRRHVYIAENAIHAEAYASNPKKYEKEVDKFLTKYYM